jgi:hypothetical protein
MPSPNLHHDVNTAEYQAKHFCFRLEEMTYSIKHPRRPLEEISMLCSLRRLNGCEKERSGSNKVAYDDLPLSS